MHRVALGILYGLGATLMVGVAAFFAAVLFSIIAVIIRAFGG